jgi:hypothetical protein
MLDVQRKQHFQELLIYKDQNQGNKYLSKTVTSKDVKADGPFANRIMPIHEGLSRKMKLTALLLNRLRLLACKIEVETATNTITPLLKKQWEGELFSIEQEGEDVIRIERVCEECKTMKKDVTRLENELANEKRLGKLRQQMNITTKTSFTVLHEKVLNTHDDQDKRRELERKKQISTIFKLQERVNRLTTLITSKNQEVDLKNKEVEQIKDRMNKLKGKVKLLSQEIQKVSLERDMESARLGSMTKEFHRVSMIKEDILARMDKLLKENNIQTIKIRTLDNMTRSLGGEAPKEMYEIGVQTDSVTIESPPQLAQKSSFVIPPGYNPFRHSESLASMYHKKKAELEDDSKKEVDDEESMDEKSISVTDQQAIQDKINSTLLKHKSAKHSNSVQSNLQNTKSLFDMSKKKRQLLKERKWNSSVTPLEELKNKGEKGEKNDKNSDKSSDKSNPDTNILLTKDPRVPPLNLSKNHLQKKAIQAKMERHSEDNQDDSQAILSDTPDRANLVPSMQQNEVNQTIKSSRSEEKRGKEQEQKKEPIISDETTIRGKTVKKEENIAELVSKKLVELKIAKDDPVHPEATIVDDVVSSDSDQEDDTSVAVLSSSGYHSLQQVARKRVQRQISQTLVTTSTDSLQGSDTDSDDSLDEYTTEITQDGQSVSNSTDLATLKALKRKRRHHKHKQSRFFVNNGRVPVEDIDGVVGTGILLPNYIVDHRFRHRDEGVDLTEMSDSISSYFDPYMNQLREYPYDTDIEEVNDDDEAEEEESRQVLVSLNTGKLSDPSFSVTIKKHGSKSNIQTNMNTILSSIEEFNRIQQEAHNHFLEEGVPLSELEQLYAQRLEVLSRIELRTKQMYEKVAKKKELLEREQQEKWEKILSATNSLSHTHPDEKEKILKYVAEEMSPNDVSPYRPSSPPLKSRKSFRPLSSAFASNQHKFEVVEQTRIDSTVALITTSALTEDKKIRSGLGSKNERRVSSTKSPDRRASIFTDDPFTVLPDLSAVTTLIRNEDVKFNIRGKNMLQKNPKLKKRLDKAVTKLAPPRYDKLNKRSFTSFEYSSSPSVLDSPNLALPRVLRKNSLSPSSSPTNDRSKKQFRQPIKIPTNTRTEKLKQNFRSHSVPLVNRDWDDSSVTLKSPSDKS